MEWNYSCWQQLWNFTGFPRWSSQEEWASFVLLFLSDTRSGLLSFLTAKSQKNPFLCSYGLCILTNYFLSLTSYLCNVYPEGATDKRWVSLIQKPFRCTPDWVPCGHLGTTKLTMVQGLNYTMSIAMESQVMIQSDTITSTFQCWSTDQAAYCLCYWFHSITHSFIQQMFRG